uniref:Pre-mRNA polyadenylation factor Fip1 domain-containing protein n=1 Tax=Anopheles coluzzii TaxID=1518534 RepID=A0A8W7PM53_ANOCL
MADEGNEDSWLYGNSGQDGLASDSAATADADPAASGKNNNALWDEQEDSQTATGDAGGLDADGKRRGSNDLGSGAPAGANGHSTREQQCDDNAMDSSDLRQPDGAELDEGQDDSHLMDDDRTESVLREEERASKRDEAEKGEDGEAGDGEKAGEKGKADAADGKDKADEGAKDKGGLSDMESDIDSDEDDDINVVIGDIKSGPSYNIIKQRGPIMPNQQAANAAGVTDKTKQPAGKFSMEEFESVGMINGVPAHEFSIDSLDEKPWRKPGADITDYFNYGFNEETWRSYCERQKRMRQHESGMQQGMGGGPGMGQGGGGRLHPPGMGPGGPRGGDMRNPNDRKRGDPRERDRDREPPRRDRERDRGRDREREHERDRDRDRERKERERAGDHRSERESGLVAPKEEMVVDPILGPVAVVPPGPPQTAGSSSSSSRDDKDKRSSKPDRHKERSSHRERSRSRERSKSRRSDRSREREQRERHSRDKKKSHRKDKEDGE